MNTRLVVLLASFAMVSGAQAAPKHKKPKAEPKQSSVTVINDSWYTMQAGSTPFGIFHEVLEQRDGKYSYRYSMTKYERAGEPFYENIGALAAADLTPIAFNLNKSGAGAVETTNATFMQGDSSGVFNIEVQGARADRFKRHVAKNTILDVFFPIWLRNNWSKFRPGYRGWVQTFAEDPASRDFRPRQVRFEVKGRDSELDCTRLTVTMDPVKADWCMTSEGVLIELKVGGYHVRKASSEAEAQAFIAGVAAKAKPAKSK